MVKKISNASECSVADLDLGSGAFLTLDPGSQTNIFDILMTNFWVKNNIIFNVLAEKNFLYLFKNKISCNSMIFVATKMVGQFFPSSFGAVVRSEIRDI
jgi:hypothetical protein